MYKHRKKKTEVMHPQGWFIMCKKDTSIEDVANIFDKEKYDVEVWIAAGVSEIGVAEKTSIDIEQIGNEFRDEFSNDFVAENGIKEVFYVSFNPASFDACFPVLKSAVEKLEGAFLCADSEDFNPVYR